MNYAYFHNLLMTLQILYSRIKDIMPNANANMEGIGLIARYIILFNIIKNDDNRNDNNIDIIS